MIPEHKAAHIVWRIVAPTVTYDDFEDHLINNRRPEWNQAVSAIADAMREYAQEQIEECSAGPDVLVGLADDRLTGLESTLGLEPITMEVT